MSLVVVTVVVDIGRVSCILNVSIARATCMIVYPSGCLLTRLISFFADLSHEIRRYV
jgi:hypothetical protein